MLKEILTPIVFFLLVYGLLFPGTVKAVCEPPDPSGGVPCAITCTTDKETYCCSHQNECYNLQQTEGPGSNPVTPAAPAAGGTTTGAGTGTAGSPVITSIGNLDQDQKKTISVNNLSPKTAYAWVVSKMTSPKILLVEGRYSSLITTCYTSNNDGNINGDLGPFHLPGYYRLEVFKTNSSVSCTPSGNSIASQDFTVGGPTGTNCCEPLLPNYDINKDVCIPAAIIPAVGAGGVLKVVNRNTQCKEENSFCEPGSAKCFKAISTKGGKVCVDPEIEKLKNPNFKLDPATQAICSSSLVKEIEGCTSDSNNPGIPTAIGCIHTNPVEFVKDLMKFIVAISGGFAFLMMLLGAFQMLTSQGNPDSLNAGRERLTNAVIGLLFVIFAILLMQIIGVGILDIPGFKQP